MGRKEEYDKQYYKNNKEKINKYKIQWAKNNKEKVKESKSRYRKNNIEKIKKYKIQWDILNIGKIKKYNKTNFFKKKNRDVKRKYGITIDQYRDMLSQQLSGCSICNKTIIETGKLLGIDHDHETKKIRGLLCDKCNRGLGFFNDDIELLTKAIKYLKKWKEN